MTSTKIFNSRRIERARLAANMSHTDLAFAVRRITSDDLKPNDTSIRNWISGKHTPSADAVAAIAAATDHDVAFFFEEDTAEDEEADELLRELRRHPSDRSLSETLRLRLIERLESREVAGR